MSCCGARLPSCFRAGGPAATCPVCFRKCERPEYDFDALEPVAQSACAAPSVAWPQSATSHAGVNQRIAKRCGAAPSASSAAAGGRVFVDHRLSERPTEARESHSIISEVHKSAAPPYFWRRWSSLCETPLVRAPLAHSRGRHGRPRRSEPREVGGITASSSAAARAPLKLARRGEARVPRLLEQSLVDHADARLLVVVAQQVARLVVRDAAHALEHGARMSSALGSPPSATAPCRRSIATASSGLFGATSSCAPALRPSSPASPSSSSGKSARARAARRRARRPRRRRASTSPASAPPPRASPRAHHRRGRRRCARTTTRASSSQRSSSSRSSAVQRTYTSCGRTRARDASR